MISFFDIGDSRDFIAVLLCNNTPDVRAKASLYK